MAERGVRLLVAVCVLALISTVAQAQQTAHSANTVVPRLIKFSGNLLDERGSAMKGPVGVTFALYTGQSGGAALWMETQNVEPDSNGNYIVLLGAASTEGIPQELFASGEARWLGIQVENQAEQPRVLLVSVPYALKAGDAETLGGLPPSAFAQARSSLGESSSAASSSSSLLPLVAASTASSNNSTDPNVTTPGGTVNFLPKFDTPSDVKTSQIFDNGTNVGIGFPVTPTPVPIAKLDVDGSANIRGTLQLPATGTANSTTKGFNSEPFEYLASVFNGKAAVNQHFRWQAEPVNPGLSTASGKLNLLFASGTGTPGETGLSINNKGIINFALGQTLPLVTGNETVSGNVSANQLISTVATGTAPLTVTSKTQVANLNASFLGGLPPSAFASSGSNAFITSQSITTNITGVSLTITQNGTGAALAVSTIPPANAMSGSAIVASSTGHDGTIVAENFGSGPALLLDSPINGGDFIGTGTGVFSVSHAGTGMFTGAGNGSPGTGLPLNIGDVGCGVGDSGLGSAGLQVSGSLNCASYNLLGDGQNTFLNAPSSVGAIKFRINNADQMIIRLFNLGVLVGINTTTPDETLTVNGTADKVGGGSWDTFSDGRLKNVFGGFHSGLKQVLQLNPVRYQYKEENPLGIHDSAEHIGLVAQEVEKVIPEAVSANNKGYLLVNNDPIIWSMLNAIKEQQRQIRAQQKQLRLQAAELAKLKARLEGPAAQPAPR